MLESAVYAEGFRKLAESGRDEEQAQRGGKAGASAGEDRGARGGS